MTPPLAPAHPVPNALAPADVCCPACRGDLAGTPEDGLTCGACGRAYGFEGSVPVLIPPEHRPPYLDHYHADSEEVDYFEVPDPATAHEERRLRERIAAAVPASAEAILDVGCGSAWVAARFTPEGRRVFSLDASARNPQEALRRYPLPTHAALAADALRLPFRDGAFGAVVAAEILEHVVDPRAFVAEAFRVVRPGGVLIVTTPYRERIRETLCVHCNRMTPLHGHLHSFDEHALRALYTGADLAGFRWQTFSNKGLTHARTHVVLGRLPFRAWRAVDAAANRLLPRPYRILVEYTKRG